MATVTLARRTHDFILQNLTSTPATAVNLVCQRDKNGFRQLTEGRLPLRAPAQAIGDLSYTQFDPSANLSYSQSDFSGGALLPRYAGGTVNRYASSDGLDPRWENILTLGMELEGPLWFLAKNLNAETVLDEWTDANGGSLNRDTSIVRTGSASWKVLCSASAPASYAYVTLANPVVYRSKSITFAGYIRASSVPDEAVLIIEDSAGRTQGTGGGDPNTWRYQSVTRTIDSGATYVRIGFGIATGTTSAISINLDDAFLLPAGGIVCNGVAELNDNLYGIFGRFVCQWDEGDDVWNAVYIHATANATDIVEFNGNIYVAFGGGDNAYIYGATTSWTVSTLSADAKHAHFFAVARGDNTNSTAMWKSRFDEDDGHHYHVASALIATNAGTWNTEDAIGSSDRHITRLYSFNETIFVGKEDGLHIYARTDTSADVASARWLNDINQYVNAPDSDNFSQGAEFFKHLYLIASQQSFFRHTGTELQNISGLLFAPRLGDFGGRVRAMTTDPVQLWLLTDTPTTDTTVAKETWLMSVRQTEEGFKVHAMEKVGIGDINHLVANSSYLWALGRKYNTDASAYESAIYRWVLPEKTVAPALDDTPAINTGGTLDLSLVDYGLPDQDKAFQSVSIFYENNLDAEHTIAVSFALNGGSSFTTLGTANSSGTSSTFFFNDISSPETNAVGKAIQCRITMATDDTVSPRLYAIVIRANYRPARVRTWSVMVRVGSNMVALGGVRDESLTISSGAVDPTKANIITALETLEASEYPIVMVEDFDDDNSSTTRRVHIQRDTLTKLRGSENDNREEIWGFTMQEVSVA